MPQSSKRQLLVDHENLSHIASNLARHVLAVDAEQVQPVPVVQPLLLFRERHVLLVDVPLVVVLRENFIAKIVISRLRIVQAVGVVLRRRVNIRVLTSITRRRTRAAY